MTWIRRHGWWLLLVILVMITTFGVTDIISGARADPAVARALTGLSLAELEAESAAAYGLYDFMVRANGYTLVVFGLLGLAVLVLGYRRGQRWARWALWVLPVWAAGVPVFYLVAGLVPGEPLPPPVVSGPVVAALSALVLLAGVTSSSAGDPQISGMTEPERLAPDSGL